MGQLADVWDLGILEPPKNLTADSHNSDAREDAGLGL